MPLCYPSLLNWRMQQVFFEDLNDDGVVRAKYYLYMYHKGPSYWYHYVWVYDSDHDGVDEYLACDVKTFYAK